jgi:hypothetical protein
MNINWIRKGEEISPGVEEGAIEIDYYPKISAEVLFGDVKPPTKTDAEEREWLINETQTLLPRFRENPLTREGVFYNTHPSELPVNCVNLFHFQIRKIPDGGTYSLNLSVYARSMHFANLAYDIVTIERVYKQMFKLLMRESIVINGRAEDLHVGKISIKIASLHYYEKQKS